MHRSLVVVAMAMATLALALPVTASSPPRPLTIATQIDFSEFPFSGTFTVPVGAADLGCTDGNFVDLPRGNGLGPIEKHFTCTAGAGAGDGFVVLFKNACTFLSQAVFRCLDGPGDLNGHWSVLAGTGQFERLSGTGRLSVVGTGPTSGEETLSGRIHS